MKCNRAPWRWVLPFGIFERVTAVCGALLREGARVNLSLALIGPDGEGT